MTVSLYPTRTIERYINSAWEDITAYVVGKIHIDIGFLTDGYADRLAKPGKFDFTLNNNSGHFNLDTEFNKNMLFRITVTWYGLSKVYICYLESIDPPKLTIGAESKFIGVHANDWLGVAYRHELKSVVVQQNKTIDQAATTLLADTPIDPTNTNFDTGTQTFPIVFDAIRMGKTTLYAELNHLNMSELGHTYIANNDTLVIENYSHRNQYIPLTEYTYNTPTNDGSALLKSDGGFLLKSDGGHILLNMRDAQTYNSTLNRFQDVDPVKGKNVINDVSFSAHPRRLGTTLSQIGTFNLYTYVDSPPILIPNGETRSLKGRYSYETTTITTPIDAAMDVADMVEQGSSGPNDSEFRLDPSGTTGMTLTFIGGADAWRWEITNNSGVDKALEYYFIWGRTIYKEQSIELLKEDTTSQNTHGKNSLSIDMPYQQTLTLAAAEASAILTNEADPRMQIKSVSNIANANMNELAAFMLTDIGDLRRVILTNPAKDTMYFIHGIKASISEGGIIDYKFTLKEKFPPTVSQRSLAVQDSPVNSYIAVAWSPELSLFVAVGDSSGTTTHIMTSPNGQDWTARTSPNVNYYAVCWSPELSLLVAVGNNAVATSPDGITWTSRTPGANRDWRGVAWSASLGLFCAVAGSGTGNRVMTSPDGITWTPQTSAADNNWRAIAWSPSLGLFAACAWSGTADRIMTSPDGINWTTRTTTDRQWLGICWSAEQAKFVSIAAGYSMVSTNGTTWTESSHAGAGDYHYITYSPALNIYMTVAGAAAAGNRRVMYSTNGTSWTILVPPEENGWTGICWSEELSVFVIVGTDGTHRVMTF